MKHSMEYLKEKLLTALWVALFSGCAALAVIGQKTISYLSAGLMLAGLAGMLLLLYIYNRKHR